MSDVLVHVWGEAGAPAVVCLHGVQAHGRRFRRLAEEVLVPAGFRVLAPDLRGHGRSTWEPPWNLETHLRDVLVFEDDEPVRWIGHSFGGRLALELLGRVPERTAAAVLLDPALRVEPGEALALAEEAAAGRSWATRADALAWRRETAPFAPEAALEEELREHLAAGPDGRFRFRHSPAAVAAMYGELAAPPWTARSPYDPTGETVPPVLVLVGRDSNFVTEDDLAGLRRWFGPALETATVPGGHLVLWEAFDETAAAIEAFLSK